MADQRRARMAVVPWGGIVGAVVILYALVVPDGVAWYLKLLALPVALLVAGAGVALQGILNPALGLGCPHCRKVALELRSISSFGYRYYRCSGCGVRCRRTPLGGWRDASDPSFAAIYEDRKRDDDPWSVAPGLEDEDLIASETHASLIRSKRDRRPENPNGPGLG